MSESSLLDCIASYGTHVFFLILVKRFAEYLRINSWFRFACDRHDYAPDRFQVTAAQCAFIAALDHRTDEHRNRLKSSREETNFRRLATKCSRTGMFVSLYDFPRRVFIIWIRRTLVCGCSFATRESHHHVRPIIFMIAVGTSKSANFSSYRWQKRASRNSVSIDRNSLYTFCLLPLPLDLRFCRARESISLFPRVDHPRGRHPRYLRHISIPVYIRRVHTSGIVAAPIVWLNVKQSTRHSQGFNFQLMRF